MENNNKNSSYFDFLSRLAKEVANLFGENCETVICRPDLSDKHIVEIYNGHVTGRKIGDKMSSLGLKQRERQDFTTDWSSYITKTSNGKTIKSLSLYLNIEGIPYVFGINYDCSDIIHALPAMKLLEDFISIPTTFNDDFTESYIKNIEDDIDKAIDMINKSPLAMNTQDRKSIVENLRQIDFFKINGSVKILAQKLNISHHTVYKYIRELEKENK